MRELTGNMNVQGCKGPLIFPRFQRIHGPFAIFIRLEFARPRLQASFLQGQFNETIFAMKNSADIIDKDRVWERES